DAILPRTCLLCLRRGETMATDVPGSLTASHNSLALTTAVFPLCRDHRRARNLLSSRRTFVWYSVGLRLSFSVQKTTGSGYSVCPPSDSNLRVAFSSVRLRWRKSFLCITSLHSLNSFNFSFHLFIVCVSDDAFLRLCVLAFL